MKGKDKRERWEKRMRGKDGRRMEGKDESEG